MENVPCCGFGCVLQLAPGSWLAAHACPRTCPVQSVCDPHPHLSAPVFSPGAAVVPSPGQAVYAAAKAGLRAYFQSMASELSDRHAYGPCSRPARLSGLTCSLSLCSSCSASLLAWSACGTCASMLCHTLLCRGVGATICCPGPLATGGDGKPRLVYGPKGLIQQAATGEACFGQPSACRAMGLTPGVLASQQRKQATDRSYCP